MRFIKAGILALVVVWLQLATIPAIRPLEVVPNLALVFVVMLAIRLDLAASLGLAVAMGWLLDAGAGSDYGLRTTFYALVVLLIATLRELGSDLENLSLQASCVVVATVLFNIVILANLATHHASLPLGEIGLKLAAEIVFNLIILVPVRWLLNWVMGRQNDIRVSIGGRRG